MGGRKEGRRRVGGRGECGREEGGGEEGGRERGVWEGGGREGGGGTEGGSHTLIYLSRHAVHSPTAVPLVVKTSTTMSLSRVPEMRATVSDAIPDASRTDVSLGWNPMTTTEGGRGEGGREEGEGGGREGGRKGREGGRGGGGREGRREERNSDVTAAM